VEEAMREFSKLKLICTSFCRQYNTEAKFYVDEADSSGIRHLVVIYAAGGYGGEPEFASGIPNLWTDDDIIDLILRDRAEMKYPVWETPAREFGSPMLDRSSPIAGN
jgi:hypothetical protein